MDSGRTLAAVLLGILHLLLIGMLLDDLRSRKHILGRKKIPWAIIIVCVPLAGALVYMLCHPKIVYGSDDKEDN